jgi:hypothetical protein
LGYRVIEEYIAMGRDMASNVWPTSANAESGSTAGPDLEQMNRRVMQYASDFAAAWVDLVEKTMTSNPGAATGWFNTATSTPGGGTTSTGSSSAGSQPRSASGTTSRTAPPPIRVAFEVRSTRRTRISADVHGTGRSFTTQRLRPADGEGPGLPVSTRFENEQLVLTVDVPPDTAPGRYTGCVVDDASNVTRGTVSLDVLAPSEANSDD